MMTCWVDFEAPAAPGGGVTARDHKRLAGQRPERPVATAELGLGVEPGTRKARGHRTEKKKLSFNPNGPGHGRCRYGTYRQRHTHTDRHTTPQVSLSLYDMPRPHRRNMAGIFSPGCQKVRVGSGRVRAEAGGREQWRLAAWCLCACGPCMRTGRKSVGGEVELRMFFLRVLLIGPETSWTVARFWCEPSAHQSRRHAQVDRSVQELFRSGRFWEARQLNSTNSDFGRF